jgi:hypothetical protein
MHFLIQRNTVLVKKYQFNQVFNNRLDSFFFVSFSTSFTRSIFLSFVFYIQVLFFSLKSFFLSFDIYKGHPRRCRITSCCFSCYIFFPFRKRENEKRKTLNTNKSTQLSSFVSRLFFPLILFCLLYPSIHLFFFLHSIVSHTFDIVC